MYRKTAVPYFVQSIILGFFLTGWWISVTHTEAAISSKQLTALQAQSCTGFPMTAKNEAQLNNAIDCYNLIALAGAYTIDILNDFSLTADSTKIDNTTGSVELIIEGNGFTLDGGGVAQILHVEESSVSIIDLTLDDGSSSAGGGLLVASNGSVDLIDSTISNSSAPLGGAIFTRGILKIVNSTISGNTASDDGAGIHMSGGELRVENSTISNNDAVDDGGGIFHAAGKVDIFFSTFALNEAGFGGAIYHSADNFNLFDSIIADSTGGGNCINLGSLTADGTNIDTDGTCDSAVQYTSAEVNLGPLQDNGGPTLTHALMADSVAIDASAIDASFPTDQRGIARQQGSLYDTGSYETTCYGFPMTAGTEFELNAAIDCFNIAPSGDYGISVTADILLMTNTVPISNPLQASLTISGNNYTIDGDNIARVLNIQNNTIMINDVTLQKGHADPIQCWFSVGACGGVIFISEHSTVTLNYTSILSGSAELYGGGIFNNGAQLFINESTIMGNASEGNGGGLFTIIRDATGLSKTVTIQNSSIISNSAVDRGGGIYNRAVMTISNSTISNNSTTDAFSDGGGIYNQPVLDLDTAVALNSLTIENSLVSSNSSYAGGGIYNLGSLNLFGTVVSDNFASLKGGGIFDSGFGVTKTNIENTEIRNNTSDGSGGGIIIFSDDVFITNSFILSNTAASTGGGISVPFSERITITHSTISNNMVNGSGSNFLGGGIEVRASWFTLSDSLVSDNSAPGSGGGIYMDVSNAFVVDSTVMGNAAGEDGGGISNESSSSDTLSIEGSNILSNTAGLSGGGIYNEGINFSLLNSTLAGNSADKGGGLFNQNFASFITPTVKNTTISNNSATETGGGIHHEGLNLEVSNTTLANNSAVLGGGIYNQSGVFGGSITVQNSIIADSASGGDCFNSSGVMTIDSINLDSDGSCENATQSAAINLGPLQDNGGPSAGTGQTLLTHALLPGSDAIDAASVDPNVVTDQRGILRDGSPDVGAYEVETIVYVSSSSAGIAGGVTFVDEDILAYNKNADTWMRYFDGSDVGLSGDPFRDLDAFTILADGSILLSIAGASTVPDVGAIDDSDIVRFIPSKIGPKTEGTYEMYFDGSDVGLDTDKEDIDAIAVLPDGRIIISTLGTAQTLKQFGNTLNSLDEDLIAFTPTSLGENTAGYFSLYADGSDFGLDTPVEDLWGIAVLNNENDLYINPAGIFDTGTLSGTPADFFVCNSATVGAVASCGSESLFFDGPASGIGGETLDAIHVRFE